MQVLIMRHGQAQNFVERGNHDDSQRALTEHGKQEASIMASWLDKKHLKPSQVFVSPYIRAQETCDIMTANMQSTITTLDIITPEGNAKQVHDYIDGYLSELVVDSNKQTPLLIVSHMPLVSYLVAQLTQSMHTPIFATGGIAHIDYNIRTMKGQLLAMVSPTQLQ
ncbi:phosphohistidine phosphatase SixA [Colwelliaceae bacterium MEBiC 14330]